MNYQLVNTSTGLGLTLPPLKAPYQIDFQRGSLHYRYTHLKGRNELIAKAVGWKKGETFHIFDTTAGFGREAFLLAALGCHLTLFERNPTIAALLKDALMRAKQDPKLTPVISRMNLLENCAIQHLAHQSKLLEPDVIYCDPMFEVREKSAAVKKEMQLLQAVVGEDRDPQTLVALALQFAKKRVVVKRALHAPSLHENPSLIFRARSHRFDVYFI